MYKQVIVIRKDLKMGKGKCVAQGAHASLQAYKMSSRKARDEWESVGGSKIAVSVDSRKALLDVFKKAKSEGLPCSLVKDAGLTQTKPGTLTAVAIGPAPSGKVERITSKLKLL